MSKHMGHLLEKAIRASEYPISKLAKRVGYTRQHLYNLFQQSKVDIFLLEEIGKIIKHDFSEDITELKKYSKKGNKLYGIVSEPLLSDEGIEKKYMLLLEEYNQLLKEHNALLKKIKKV